MQPGPRADLLTERVLAVADAVGAFIEVWGFKSIHGRVWALLALHREPMSQIEIAETLGVSRSLISAAVAELVAYHLVEATGEHRNAPYVVRMDVWPTITEVLRGREWMLMERARLALEAAVTEAEVRAELGQAAPWDLGRMRVLLAMTRFAQAVLRAVLAIRVPHGAEAFRDWLEASARVVGRLKKVMPGG